MERTLIKPGGVGNAWVLVVIALAVVVGAITLGTDVGLPAALAGTAGAYFALGGVRALWQAVASRSVERAAIGELGGRAAAVEVEGTVGVAEEPVTAPMTGTESVAYRVTVAEHVPDRTE